MKLLPVLALTLIVAPIMLLVAGQFGLLKGSMPDDLGVRDGKLMPPSRSANSVSSQALLYDWDGARDARIEPLPVSGSGPNAGAQTLTDQDRRACHESAGRAHHGLGARLPVCSVHDPLVALRR
jgi:hypothetical protein